MGKFGSSLIVNLLLDQAVNDTYKKVSPMLILRYPLPGMAPNHGHTGSWNVEKFKEF